MPFTNARWEAYSAHTDGQVYRQAVSAAIYSGTGTASKVAAGDYAIALGASDTAILVFELPEIMRTGEPHLESVSPYENYNPPVGPPYNMAGPNPSPTSTSYNPINPVTVSKGIELTGIDLIYEISGAALTTNNVGIYLKSEANNAAPSITTLVAMGANGLQTATQTNRYVTSVAIPSNLQSFPTAPDSLLSVEWDITTAAGGAMNIFGVVFKINFNYN